MATFTFLVFLNIAVVIVFAVAASTQFRQARRFRDAADLLNAIRNHPSSQLSLRANAGTSPAGDHDKVSPPSTVTPGLVVVPADAESLAASVGVELPGSATDPKRRGPRRPWKDRS